MIPTTTRTVQTPPTFPKPTYPDAFNWVAALPPEINPYTIILLLWVWRHTNSDTTNENCGKAWKSQANLAVEMHVSDKTVQRAFDDAELRGFITREHIFKTKDGKITVSTIPYRKGTNQGRGEYQHSRYWLNWDAIRVLGVVTESTPTKLGCSQSPPQTENGVVTESTPKQIGVVTESTGVVTESTKVLIEGFSSPTRPLPWVDLTHGARNERQGGESNQGRGTRQHLVDDGEKSSQSPAAGTRFVYPGTPSVSPSSSTSSAGIATAPASSMSSVGESLVVPEVREGNGNPNTKGSGQGKPSDSPGEFEDPREARNEQIEFDIRRRQLERKESDAEIFREYKSIFDRLRRECQAKRDFEPKLFHDPNDSRAAGLIFTGGTSKYATNPVWAAMPDGKEFEKNLGTTVPHRHAAAELYRAIGRDAALEKWEDFLVNEEHEATERVEYEEGKFATDTVERTWLLHDFVLAHGVSSSKTTSTPESAAQEKRS